MSHNMQSCQGVILIHYMCVHKRRLNSVIPCCLFVIIHVMDTHLSRSPLCNHRPMAGCLAVGGEYLRVYLLQAYNLLLYSISKWELSSGASTIATKIIHMYNV